MLTIRFDKLSLPDGARVLDLGCGEGRHVHGLHMLTTAHAIGLDPDEGSLDIARERLHDLPEGSGKAEFMKGSAYDLPFPDGDFDAVICSEVLEHLSDYARAIQEIARVTKPGGVFAASVPRAWPERICWKLAPGPGGYADQPGGHVRIFDETELRESIREAGFVYSSRHFAHALHSPYWWLKTAFWGRRDDHPLVRAYQRFLEWDLLERPRVTRLAERALNPVMGKSVVLYFRKPRS